MLILAEMMILSVVPPIVVYLPVLLPIWAANGRQEVSEGEVSQS